MDAIIFEELVDDNFNWNVIEVVFDQPAVNLIAPEREISIRNQMYMENIVPNYTVSDFKDHFRMSRDSFQRLSAILTQIKVFEVI